jgi:hypothetical protein
LFELVRRNAESVDIPERAQRGAVQQKLLLARLKLFIQKSAFSARRNQQLLLAFC